MRLLKSATHAFWQHIFRIIFFYFFSFPTLNLCTEKQWLTLWQDLWSSNEYKAQYKQSNDNNKQSECLFVLHPKEGPSAHELFHVSIDHT